MVAVRQRLDKRWQLEPKELPFIGAPGPEGADPEEGPSAPTRTPDRPKLHFGHHRLVAMAKDSGNMWRICQPCLKKFGNEGKHKS